MNQYVIIGCLGGNHEIFLFHDMKAGKQVATEMGKSTVWTPIYCGSLADLITLLKKTKEEY